MNKNTKKIFIVMLSVLLLMPMCLFSVNAALIGDSKGLYYQLKNDGSAAVAEFSSSKTDVEIPQEYMGHTVNEIYSSTFQCNSSLTSVIFPDTISIADSLMFYGCTSLKYVKLSSSMTSIGGAFFFDCSSLEKVIIPDSITYIAPNAFYGAGNATILCSEGSYAQQYAIEKGLNYVLLNGKLADVNFDDKIDIIDATLIQKSLIGLTDLDVAQKYYADVNGDGVVSVDDATEIQKYLVGVESALD
ncbi:MAG: leucine-rich repeat protein [Ruminococcus sp.]|nr:leucine-rich repeat protein [Ruminococcus sp.]